LTRRPEHLIDPGNAGGQRRHAGRDQQRKHRIRVGVPQRGDGRQRQHKVAEPIPTGNEDSPNAFETLAVESHLLGASANLLESRSDSRHAASLNQASATSELQ
jgi:hypothetical protein